MPFSHLTAADFEGNEDYWQKRCSVPQKTNAEAQECTEFKKYYEAQGGELQTQIEDMNEQISNVKKDMESLADAINQQQTLINEITKKIELNEASIRTINEQIVLLNVAMQEKQASIDQRNALIMERMRGEQETTGTNMSLDVIMGAKDLLDMVRKIDGLQRITESDQQEVEKVKKEKEELELQKSEQVRLKYNVEGMKAENEQDKLNAEDIKSKQENLLSDYRKQEVEYEEKLRSVEADLNSLKSNMSNINTSVENSFSFAGDSGSFVRPVNGPLTATTWHYADGSAHLGADIGVPIGTPIYAPANGIILYTENKYPSNGGYLGNWQGWPSGAGNDIHMLTQVDGVTYAISFFHLSSEGFKVKPGQSVNAGDVIGTTGNSGNSKGAHCHIEVINLGDMALNTAIARFQGSADFAWGTGWGNGALSNRCSVSGPPCRERPEEVFGY